MAKFVHLHVHTEYSLLDGLCKIPKLVSQAKIMGMQHVAMTDHGSMYGAIKFYKECREEKINPVIGCEMYIAKKSLHIKEQGKDNESNHLTVLARDFEGYQNLMKLVTQAYLEGFYYRPRIDKELLSKHSQGLVALSGCSTSEVSTALKEGDLKKAKKICGDFIQIFGKDNFFLEIQRHEYEKFLTSHDEKSEIYAELSKMAKDEKKLSDGLKKLAKETKIPLVATNDVHYITPQDAQAQDALICIQTGKNMSDVKRLRMVDSPTYYLKSSEEMVQLFRDCPEAVTNTLKVAEKVNIEIPLEKVLFPYYPTPEKKTPEEYLTDLCFERITKRLGKVTKEVRDRLEYEISVISKKNYSTYFLVVSDFVNWSREKGIISTTRGSASGSLVSYALGITTVDPLYFKLPFERFLNLYRPTLPDIDVDFEDTRRDEVIQYVREKFGDEKVAQIGTFGTMMARAAVRDVSRVLGWPYAKADRIAKMIPIGAQGFHMSIDTAKKQNRELDIAYKEEPEVKELLDLAEKVEGNARHVSVHAAGVVISPFDLTDSTPLQRETSGEKIITQYDMYDIESVGLVKMDFLGIRNLSILGQAVKIVSERKGEEIDLTKIPLDNRKAFDILSKGETMGLFQLSGSGMTRYLKELKPTNIFDIMAMISLFRPGPMNSIPEFIERKNHPTRIKYFDPRMSEYLKESYGVIVYQDDVLLTAINIAGYTWEEADKFRKAMGKKIPAEMTRQKEKFTDGAITNGMAGEKAEELFKLIEPFAAYGFNKAHAASYAVIAYQTAYMKANYPVEFMTAVMTAESDDPDKIATAVDECAKMKIKVLPPDVNESETGFTIQKVEGHEGIRFGLSAIKNVGKAAIEAILSEREKNGPFASLDNFSQRVNLRVVNRKTMESLIKAGAMDRFGKRNAMLKFLDDVKTSGQSLSRRVAQGQGSLFDESQKEDTSPPPKSQNQDLSSQEEAPKEEILSWERELLGFYLTEHPLKKIAGKLEKLVTTKIADIDIFATDVRKVRLGGIITSIRKTFTKVKKEEMCFLKLQDLTGSIEIIVFPRVYEKSRNHLTPDQIVIVSGNLETGDQTPQVIAEDVVSFDLEMKKAEDLEQQKKESVNILIPLKSDRSLLSKIYEILKKHAGEIPAYLVLMREDGKERKVPVPFGVEKTWELEDDLENLGCKIIQ